MAELLEALIDTDGLTLLMHIANKEGSYEVTAHWFWLDQYIGYHEIITTELEARITAQVRRDITRFMKRTDYASRLPATHPL